MYKYYLRFLLLFIIPDAAAQVTLTLPTPCARNIIFNLDTSTTFCINTFVNITITTSTNVDSIYLNSSPGVSFFQIVNQTDTTAIFKLRYATDGTKEVKVVTCGGGCCDTTIISNAMYIKQTVSPIIIASEAVLFQSNSIAYDTLFSNYPSFCFSYLGSSIQTDTLILPADSLVYGPNVFEYFNCNDSIYCNFTTTLTIYVLQGLAAIANDTFCVTTPAFAVPIIESGVLFGAGIDSSNFNPVAAGVGLHTIYFIANLPGGATALDSCTVLVKAAAPPSLTLPEIVFENIPPFDAVVFPSGGTLSIEGVSSGVTIYPNLLPSLLSSVSYQYLDTITGCTASDTAIINVLPSFDQLMSTDTLCMSELPINLPTTTTIISGSGVAAGIFNVSTPGQYWIYQTATYSTSIAIDSFLIKVLPSPIAQFETFDTLFCEYDTPIILALSPTTTAGGTYSGGTSTTSTFAPSEQLCGTASFAKYIVKVGNCIASDSVLLRVECNPIINYDPLPVKYCKGSAARAITGLTPPNTTLSGPGITAGSINTPDLSNGTYSVYLQTTDTNFCTDFDTLIYQIIPLPTIVLSPYDSVICAGQTQTLSIAAPIPTATYSWQPTALFTDPNSSSTLFATTDISTPITIQITDTTLCSQINTLPFIIGSCYDGLVPELFTPNGDGKNDIFVINGIENSENVMSVFNRWGGLIISFYNYKNNWDGTIDNIQIPDGVYYYQIEIKTETKPLSGSLTIIR